MKRRRRNRNRRKTNKELGPGSRPIPWNRSTELAEDAPIARRFATLKVRCHWLDDYFGMSNQIYSINKSLASWVWNYMENQKNNNKNLLNKSVQMHQLNFTSSAKIIMTYGQTSIVNIDR